MSEEIKKYLGIDWGEKRIGLAMADSETNIALPLRTVNTLTEVLEVIEKENIREVIVGHPKKMSGEAADNPSWFNFIKQLKEKCPCSIMLLDERLSSIAVDALVGEAKDKANRDDVAATIILQDYLDRI